MEVLKNIGGRGGSPKMSSLPAWEVTLALAAAEGQ